MIEGPWLYVDGIGDVSERIRNDSGLSWGGGRSFELDDVEAATGEVVLDNRDRELEPGNPDSAHWPRVRPMRRFVAGAQYDSGTIAPLFSGFVAGWEPLYPHHGRDAVVRVKLMDGLSWLALQKVGRSFVEAIGDLEPMVYWQLAEDSGATTVTDSSGNDYHGTVSAGSGSVSFGEESWTYGKGRTAVQINEGASIATTDSDAATPPEALTVVLAIKRLANASDTIIRWSPDIIPGRYFRVNMTSTGRIQVRRGSLVVTTSAALPLDEWALLVITHGSGRLRVYIDGALEDDRSFIPVQTFSNPTALSLSSGDFSGAGARFVAADAAFFDYVLSPGQVADLWRHRLDSFPEETADERIGKLLDFAGWTGSGFGRNLDAGQSTLQAHSCNDEDVLSLIREAAQGESGLVFSDVGGVTVGQTQEFLRLSLPGTSGSQAATPHDNSFDVTDLDIRAFLALDWEDSGGTTQGIVSHWDPVNEQGWALELVRVFDIFGQLRLTWTDNGNVRTAQSVNVPNFTSNIRVTLDADDGDGSRVTFWAWFGSQTPQPLGGDVLGEATTIDSANAPMIVGRALDGTAAEGLFLNVEVYDGIDGTLVAAPDFEDTDEWSLGDDAGDTGTDSVGNVWTLAGDAEIDGTTVTGATTFETDIVFHNRHHRVLEQEQSQATFSDESGDLDMVTLAPSFDEERIYNTITATQRDGAEAAVSDAGSQSSYGRRDLERTIPTSTVAELEDAANWLLRRFREPVFRFEQLALSAHHSGVLDQMRQRKFGDRVTVKWTPLGSGDPIERDVRIEHIAHHIRPRDWRTEWRLSPAESEDAWVLGVAGLSELGETTALGY